MISIQELSNRTKNHPLIIHINPLGLLRIEKSNIDRFSSLNTLLNRVQDCGGNIAIPSYSYTYTKNEVYKISSTPSELGAVSEYLRVNNDYKRTADANFSYLLFGERFSDKHLEVSDYSTFGDGSLIEEVFNKDGYLGVIGSVWEHLTEVHYIEKKLNVDYRFDKDFNGTSVNNKGKTIDSIITFFCRYLNSENSTSFKRLKKDLMLSGLIKTWKISEYNLKIEVVKAQELLLFIKEKLLLDPGYLLKEIRK